MKKTAHSEYGHLDAVIIKPVQYAFKNQEMLSRQWKDHQFLHEPDFSEADQEFKSFQKIFEQNGTKVLQLPIDEITSIDSIYCRDASIQTDAGVILCQMGKAARRKEPEASARFYESQGMSILGSIQGSGTVEGGDVAWLNENTLAVAHAYRTNLEGIRQLRSYLEPQGV